MVSGSGALAASGNGGGGSKIFCGEEFLELGILGNIVVIVLVVVLIPRAC